MRVQLRWNQAKMNELSNRLEKILFLRQEEGILHNSSLWAEKIFEAVASGDDSKVEELFGKEIRLEGEAGVLARDPLRSVKDLMICSVSSLICRIIRENVLDSEMAYSISDACIQMVEDSQCEEEIFEVAAAFCLTLCHYSRKRNQQYHPLVRQTKEYIFKHFHEKIEIKEMAGQLGTSPAYLGKVFRQGEDMTLQHFILNEKVERGKNLLRYSDYDINTISQYLGFSSQSHFGREFKKITGFSPAAYRDSKNQMYREKM